METYRRALNRLEYIQAVLITAFYVLTIVIVTFQVLNRFIFHWPVVWTADLAVVFFVWLGLLCASQAVRKSAHFRMTVLIERQWKGGGRRVLEMVALIVILGMSAVLTIEGAMITVDGLKEVSPGLNVTMAWAYGAVPVCSFTALLFAIEKLIDQFKGRTEQTAPVEELI